MSEDFFDRPILNSPYDYPARHWELDEFGQPTNRTLEIRRGSDLITPVPPPRKQRGGRTSDQTAMVLDTGEGLSTEEQEYNTSQYINEVRDLVDQWRNLPNPDQWQVTPETARLLQHWRQLLGGGMATNCIL